MALCSFLNGYMKDLKLEMTEVSRRIYYPDLDGETSLVPEIISTSTNSQAGSFFVFFIFLGFFFTVSD